MLGLGLNWVDLLIVVFLVIAISDGYFRGFFIQFIELIAFVGAIVVALAGYRSIATWLMEVMSVSALVAKPLVFLGIWLVTGLVLSFGLRFVYNRLPKFITSAFSNKLAGIFPAFIKSVAYLGLTLMVILSLPLSSSVKRPVEESALAQIIVRQTNSLVHVLESAMGGSIAQTFNFLTTSETSHDKPAQLTPVSADRLTEEPALEDRMLILLNEERTKVGLTSLVVDLELREVARAHSRDMWIRGYFDHISPEDKNPFDRISDARIDFINAGENLALAPSVEIAHLGLMQSPSHRENILSPVFGRVGVGVISAGVDGLIVTQDFANAKY